MLHNLGRAGSGRIAPDETMSNSGNTPDFREAIVPSEGAHPAPPPDQSADGRPSVRGWCIAIAVMNIVFGVVVGFFGLVFTALCLGLGGGDAMVLVLALPVAGAAMMLSGVCLLIAGPRSLRVAAWLIISAIVCAVAYFVFVLSQVGRGGFPIPTTGEQLFSTLAEPEFWYMDGLPGLMIVIAALELRLVFKLARQSIGS